MTVGGDSVEVLDFAYQWTSTVTSSTGTLYTDYASFYNAFSNNSDTDAANESLFTLGKQELTKVSSGTINGSTSDDADWKAEFTKLPQFQKVGDDFVIYTYEISELKIKPNGKEEEAVGSTTIEGYQGETVNYFVKWSNDGTSWTVTNREKPTVEIRILKVNLEKEQIGEAVFELYKNNGSVFELLTHEDFDWIGETDNRFIVTDSGFTMTGLKDGTYKIKEVQAPAGYIITEDEPVTFTIKSGQLVEASNVLKSGVEYQAADPQAESPDDLAAFIIPNTPGAALPNTGGPGTLPYTIPGTVMVLGAGALLGRKRRESSRHKKDN